MDSNTFQLKMLGKSLVMVTDQDIVFRRKHGRWAMWNSETEEEKVFQDAESLLDYTIGGKKIGDILDEKEDFSIPLEGGRGASGSSGMKSFKFGHASGGGGGHNKSDLPARVNVRVKVKTPENAIKTFMNLAALRPDREHSVTIDRMGFANSYTHGGSSSVSLGRIRKGDLAVHNHPSGGSFSDTDLITASQQTGLRGIVATYDKGMFGGQGYRLITKGTHFKAEAFVKAVKTASMRGKDYDDAVDRWLSRNQKKYGYKFKNIKV